MAAQAFIDLYSDTKTKPTAEMRAYMMQAVVGDEQKDEDPTTMALLERVASLLEQESAVLLPSGTMCNQIALAVHCRPGDEVICERSAHVINSEAGGPAALAGATTFPINGTRGMFSSNQLRAAIRRESRYAPRSRLVCLEQTANLGGGSVWPLELMRDVIGVANKFGLRAHLDGARLMNAAIQSGVAPGEYGQLFDSVWIDFTKGLGAPIGAVLAGSRDFIREAWRLKQRLGGAMRQSGIIAAGCNFALDHHVARLKDDHANARLLAQLIAEIPGVEIDVSTVETNIVFFDIAQTGWNAVDLVAVMREHGVVVGAFGEHLIRAVTHLDITNEQTRIAGEKLAGVMSRHSDDPTDFRLSA